MDILLFVLSITAEFFLLSIPGVLFHWWAVKNGVIRKNLWAVFGLVLFAVLLKRFFYSSISPAIFALIVVFGSTIGVNRAGIHSTMRRGRWWWLNE